MTIRVSKKSVDIIIDKMNYTIDLIFYGIFLLIQFIIPISFAYGVYLLFTESNVIVYGLTFAAGMIFIILFRILKENGEKTVYHKINCKLHILGWKNTQ